MAVLKILNRKEGEGYLLNCITYLMRPDKNPQGLYFGYNFLITSNPYQICCQFEAVASLYAKRRSLTPIHFILSFSSDVYCDEEYCITPYKAALIAYHICLYHFQNYQVMYGIHNDESHLHIHFIVNPISLYDGSMLNLNYEEQHKLFDSVQLVLNQPHKWGGKYQIKLEAPIRYE